MRIFVTKFQEWELKELIPAYGENISEVLNFILTNWLMENGSKANHHNQWVKQLVQASKIKK